MDLLTQGVLGAAMAVSAAPAREARAAALVGSLAGLLPDADALIRSTDDPLLVLEYHRHFSHALVFIAPGAGFAALLAWPLMRRRLRLARIGLYALLGYCLAGLLDACTSYGTHLLWPFSEQAVAWSIIAIVDPVFTLLLLVPLAIALTRRRGSVARVGLVLAALYLALASWQHLRALEVARDVAESRGDQPVRLLVKPTIGNIVLWRSVYEVDGQVQVDAMRVGVDGSVRVHAGERAELVSPETADLPRGSRFAEDLERFHHLAEGWTVRHPTHADTIGDARYAMLPTSLAPLWGITPGDTPDAPTRLISRRDLTPAMRQRFVHMLLGRAP